MYLRWIAARVRLATGIVHYINYMHNVIFTNFIIIIVVRFEKYRPDTRGTAAAVVK